MYIKKTQNMKTLNNSAGLEDKNDTKVMCQNLMQEMLWAKPPSTIELFTIKKQMQVIPVLKDKSITSMKRGDYNQLKESEWSQMLTKARPCSVYDTEHFIEGETSRL